MGRRDSCGHRGPPRVRQRSAQPDDDHPERPRVQRMASSPAQSQEDVAAPARPAVGRRSLDDLPADPRRPDALARHGDEARPWPPRAPRRRRHRRSTSAWSPSGATNPTARVEYALRADELLSEPQVRQIMEYYLAVRMRRFGRAFQPSEAHDEPTAGPPGRALRSRSAGPSSRASARPPSRMSPVDRSADLAPIGPADGPARRSARRPRATTDLHQGIDPDRPPRPGLGDSERRRLGRRRSHFRAGNRRLPRRDADGGVAGCGPRSRTFEVRSLRSSAPPCPRRPSATNAVGCAGPRAACVRGSRRAPGRQQLVRVDRDPAARGGLEPVDQPVRRPQAAARASSAGPPQSRADRLVEQLHRRGRPARGRRPAGRGPRRSRDDRAGGDRAGSASRRRT